MGSTSNDIEAPSTTCAVPDNAVDTGVTTASFQSSPSIRDEVRRFLSRHKFQPSTTRFSSVSEIYALYLSDHSLMHTPQREERFRSALGRVLRPPKTAGAYAQLYAVPNLVRRRGYISIVSPSVRSVDPHKENVRMKSELGETMRQIAATSDKIKQIRQKRALKAKNLRECPPLPEVHQQLNFRYVDEFMQLHCASDLCSIKVFPNGKEMAESMAAYDAVRRYLHHHKPGDGDADGILSFRDPNVLLLVVGDGSTPRTAATFAFRSAWRCVSIDPEMRMEENRPWKNVSCLETRRARIQDCVVQVFKQEKVVVILWHAHVSIKDAIACLRFENGQPENGFLRDRVAVVACPCCNYAPVQNALPLDSSEPDVVYEDASVPGLMRTVHVWKFRKAAENLGT